MMSSIKKQASTIPKLDSCKPPMGKSKLALPKGHLPSKIGYYAEKGPREYMEDTYQVMHFNANGKKGTFYGVFDGHGGKDVSYQLINTKTGLFPFLIQKLKINKNKGVNAIPKLLKEAFVEYDRILFGKKLKSGSTAAVILRYDDKLYQINLGDSRSMVFFEGDSAVKSTADHKPWLSTEKTRIYRAGYYVNPFKIYTEKKKKKYDNGDIYVGNGGYFMYLTGKWESITEDQYKQIELLNSDVDTHRVCNSLALSRAFGDFYLKVNKDGQYMGINAAVSPEPDVTAINLKPKKGKTAYLLIASDGFWDVARITAAFKNMLKTYPNERELCKILVKDALTKGSQDNTSVVFDRFPA